MTDFTFDPRTHRRRPVTGQPYGSHATARPAAAPRAAGAYLPDALSAMIIFLATIQMYNWGKLPALGWLGLTVLLILARPLPFWASLLKWWPLLLMPLISFLSFLWSDSPGVSARYGFQLLLIAVAGVYLARLLGPSRFLTALFCAMFMFCVFSILSQRTGPSATGPVLIGLTGSKNQMAAIGQLLVLTSLAMVFHGGAPRLLRLASLPGMAIGAFVVFTTESATAMVLAAAVGGLFVALVTLHRVRPGVRAALMTAFALLISPTAFIIPEIVDGTERFMIEVLHKDPGLTGRVELWEHADTLAARRPVLGYGYESVWRGDSTEAISLSRLSHGQSGRGFNFHNSYKQAAVDIGYVGMGIFVVVLVASLVAGMLQYVAAPTVATSFFFAFYIGTLFRSLTDVVYGPFSYQTLLLMMCCVFAFWKNRKTAAPAAAPAAVSPVSAWRAAGGWPAALPAPPHQRR